MPENKESNNLNLRSEEVQEILTTPPSWIIRWGVSFIFIFSVLLIVLSFIIKYPDFVSAKILVTTKEPTEKIIARNSGSIEKIIVENQDTLKVGQPIAILKNTAKYNDVKILKQILDSVDFNIENFSFPLNLTSRLRLGEIEPAYIDFERSYLEYSLLNDLKPYENDLAGNNNTLKEIKKQLNSQISQKALLEKEMLLKQYEFERQKTLFDKGVISKQEFEKKQLDILQTQKNVNTIAISISQIRDGISNANQNLRATFINQNKDNRNFFKNLLQSYNSLNRAVDDWEFKYVLASSTVGKVSFQEFWSANQQVNLGDVVFSILPLNKSELVGKLTIPSQNAGKVIIGQKVLIKLDNFPYQQFGMLIGQVKNISVSPDLNGNYFVYISVPNGVETSYNKVLPFNQELIGNAEIITEDLSVAERLFYKVKGIFTY